MTDDQWQAVLDPAARLKHIGKCAASITETQPCVVQDVRYIGRELTRIAQAQRGGSKQKSKGEGG